MANTNNNRDNKKHLFYLNELSDYKVASDDPDVRGWEVQDRDNRVVGKVDNLLVNKNTERVVYLDVEVDKSIIEANHEPYRDSANTGVHEFINKDGENHLIVPVGLVRLNTDKNFVYTDKINHRTFAETKRIKKGSNVDREYEIVVLDSYERADRDAATGTSNKGDLPGADSKGVEDRQNEPFQDSRERTSGSTARTPDTDKEVKRATKDENDPAFKESRGRKADHNFKSEDDDSFYKRREFDRTNYRSNKK